MSASFLDRLRLVLDALPDEDLVRFLEQRRGRGRDDYPIRPMWRDQKYKTLYPERYDIFCYDETGKVYC